MANDLIRKIVSIYILMSEDNVCSWKRIINLLSKVISNNSHKKKDKKREWSTCDSII